jgi:hypothetical protein
MYISMSNVNDRIFFGETVITYIIILTIKNCLSLLLLQELVICSNYLMIHSISYELRFENFPRLNQVLIIMMIDIYK